MLTITTIYSSLAGGANDYWNKMVDAGQVHAYSMISKAALDSIDPFVTFHNAANNFCIWEI
jgi:hypothetical protein